MVLTKVSRTFPVRLDFELNKAFNAICVRHGDVTYHIENALRAYIPTVQADNATIPVLAKQPVKKAVKKFKRPWPEELTAYFNDRGCQNSDDEAIVFWNFYESKGWVVGKAPMKCWKAAVRNWLKRSNDNGQNKPNGTTATNRLTPTERVQAKREAANQRSSGVGFLGDNDQAVSPRMDEQGGGGTNRPLGETIDGSFTRSD